MTRYALRMILICSFLRLLSCIIRKKQSDTTQQIHRTGEAIAIDDLLREYEREHQKFYEAEIKHGNYLDWSGSEDQNLSNYCRKYLNHSVPTKITFNTVGIKTLRILHYKKQNINTTSDIIVLSCKVIYKKYPRVYYITRAPEPNCVYALKSIGNPNVYAFTIINKYCDFENDLSMKDLRKRKREESLRIMHRHTGQPIAKEEYLFKYELEHQELFKMEEKENMQCSSIEWSYAMEHPNLNSYCYQYMEACAPGRKQKGMLGSCRIEKLHYQKLSSNEDINITAVTCLPFKESKRKYHMTRALETNCVYALLRIGFKATSPLVIIFKHCDFEDLHNQQFISHSFATGKMVIPKTEIKEKALDTFKTLEIFPHY